MLPWACVPFIAILSKNSRVMHYGLQSSLTENSLMEIIQILFYVSEILGVMGVNLIYNRKNQNIRCSSQLLKRHILLIIKYCRKI